MNKVMKGGILKFLIISQHINLVFQIYFIKFLVKTFLKKKILNEAISFANIKDWINGKHMCN